MKVTVLGGGITGVTSAWFLAQAGHEVTVIDRQPNVALETSFANGGQLSVGQSEPWANPHVLPKILRWLWREDSPLLFRPQWDRYQWLWAAQFLRECLPGRAADNIRQMVSLGMYSRQTVQMLRQSLGLDYDCLQKGILQLYFSPREMEEGVKAARLLTELGCERNVLTVAEAVQLEPALQQCQHKLQGATYTPGDESGDARRFTEGLAERCKELGVQFRFETTVLQLVADTSRVHSLHVRLADGSERLEPVETVLVCLGSYSPLLLRSLGMYFPVYPAKGYSATVSTEGCDGAPVVSLTDDSAKIVMTRLGERWRIAGTAELSGYDLTLNPVRCQALLKRAQYLFPKACRPETVEYWTGLRPSTPSNVPLIGQTRIRNLFLNTGHGTLGWTEGAGSGRAVAAIISGQEPDIEFGFITPTAS